MCLVGLTTSSWGIRGSQPRRSARVTCCHSLPPFTISLPLRLPLQLRSWTIQKLDRRSRQSQLPRLLDLCLENDLVVPFLPHLRHQRLAGEHGAREADLDVLEGAVSEYITSLD